LDQRLKVLHCNDPYCTGGGESLTSPDPQRGQWPSILLDASGNPVISYYTTVFDKLKVLHCNDPNCATGGDTIATPDPGTFLLESPTSLALDAAGNPVVAYTPPYELRVLHCNDPLCVGLIESITTHDIYVGAPSIALDASGYPVIAYYKTNGVIWTTGTMKVMHCNDADCAPGNNETTATPDAGPGITPSLRLDASGRPVIAYDTGSTTNDLKVMHCNDVNCAGMNETIMTPDSVGDVGGEPSLLLDGGNPLVSYRDETNGSLKLLRCNDANCALGGDAMVSLDSASDSGEKSALALDASGHPVVTYDAGTDLHLLRCGSPSCQDAVGGLTELSGALAAPASGGPPLAAIIAAVAVGALALAAIAWRAFGRLGTLSVR